MGRIRTIKPDFFKHEALFDAEVETGFPLRIAFAGIWTICDREGRFEWRPRAIKTDVLPYDDVDFPRVLDALATRGFLVRYRVDGKEYGFVPGFIRHQVVNGRESASILPAPPEDAEFLETSTRDARDDDPSPTRHDPAHGEGKGREGERKGREREAAQAQQRECEREDRPLRLRGQVIAALGMKGDELNTGATFPIKGMDRDNWPMRLAVWDQHGLTDDQIVLAIKARIETARKDDPAFRPSGIKYFDGAIADFARDLKSGKSAPPGEPDVPAPPQFTAPDHIAKNAAIRAEWETVKDKTDPEAKARKLELARQLNALKEEAGV